MKFIYIGGRRAKRFVGMGLWSYSDLFIPKSTLFLSANVARERTNVYVFILEGLLYMCINIRTQSWSAQSVMEAWVGNSLKNFSLNIPMLSW